MTASEANQSNVHQNILHGGRSRLHLIDFGCCERTKTLGGSITIAGLGNVILGILNGQRHLPFKESKVTQLLREVLGSVSCQVCHDNLENDHSEEKIVDNLDLGVALEQNKVTCDIDEEEVNAPVEEEILMEN